MRWRLELVHSGKQMAPPPVDGAGVISQVLWNEKLNKRECLPTWADSWSFPVFGLELKPLAVPGSSVFWPWELGLYYWLSWFSNMFPLPSLPPRPIKISTENVVLLKFLPRGRLKPQLILLLRSQGPTEAWLHPGSLWGEPIGFSTVHRWGPTYRAVGARSFSQKGLSSKYLSGDDGFS